MYCSPKSLQGSKSGLHRGRHVDNQNSWRLQPVTSASVAVIFKQQAHSPGPFHLNEVAIQPHFPLFSPWPPLGCSCLLSAAVSAFSLPHVQSQPLDHGPHSPHSSEAGLTTTTSDPLLTHHGCPHPHHWAATLVQGLHDKRNPRNDPHPCLILSPLVVGGPRE